jgi:hypothetical protein
MPRIPASLLAAVLLVTALAAAPPPAAAAWPHDPAANVPVCTAAGAQYNARLAPDGAGGAIVVWWDQAGRIYAQRLSAGGVPLWTLDGVAVCTAVGSRERTSIAPDGAGGAVIAWQDVRNYVHSDIYVQRLSADGVPQWTADGVALCTAAGDQRTAALVGDGSGGAVVTWLDYRAGNADIYARRISASGVPQGTADGVALCDATNDQTYPVITTDGRGGAVVAWTDARTPPYLDIYAQRLSASDSPAWTDDGVAVCTMGLHQDNATIASDGAGGAIVVWRDARSGTDIYAQRVGGAGVPQWTTDGVVLGTGAGFRSNPVAVPDLAGGAIVAWYDMRGADSDIYAQRVSPAGTALWTAGGLPLCTATGGQYYPRIAADGAGGAIVGWYDERTGEANVHAQRLTAGGAPLWTADGVAVCTALGAQTEVVVASDGGGGAILTWYDERPGTDVYAQRVDRWGYLGAEPAIVSARDVPNDQGGRVKVSWDASPLENDLLYENIDSYRVYRSVPSGTAALALASGVAIEEAGLPALDGVRDYLLVTTQGALTYYWEYVATVTADHLPGYSYVVPTAGDSIAGSNPLTLFMVQARSAGGAQWWNSAPDSGYSVDNLAPEAPALFTGEYASGTATLHWAANPAPDLAGYRLYRGSAADFVPGPENLVVAQPDTGYTDAVGALYYYKLCAVDVHGNVSPCATLLPSGTTDAPGPAMPRAVFLAPPTPNPARGPVTLRFGLPRAANVELALFDQQGRRLRSLLTGAQPAGEHTLTRDGRDEDGHALPAGLYFVRLAAEGRTFVSRLAVIR